MSRLKKEKKIQWNKIVRFVGPEKYRELARSPTSTAKIDNI